MICEQRADTRIARLTLIEANDFLARFEILGSVGLGVWHWGLLDPNNLLSVISYGTTCFGGRRGWIGEIARSNGVRIFQLCRGGTTANARKGTPSRAISLASRAMRKLHGPFVAVAYADESLGEIGTIYQASGAFYTGMTRPKGQANYIINGQFLSGWKVRRLYGTRDRTRLARIDPKVKVFPLTPKHRYIFVSAPKILKKKIRHAIAAHTQPFPKRPGSV